MWSPFKNLKKSKEEKLRHQESRAASKELCKNLAKYKSKKIKKKTGK